MLGKDVAISYNILFCNKILVLLSLWYCSMYKVLYDITNHNILVSCYSCKLLSNYYTAS